MIQETILFNTTIRENIRYGRLDATDDEVEEAARAANIAHVIEALPRGYDTKLGEDGRQTLRRREAAHRHRPRHSLRPAHPDSGRGDLLARLRDGEP